jgi:predicted Co/Zn/Cd cation transporter (cation efflux family)
MRGSRPLALALLVLAVIFALAAIFYFTQKTEFLAGGTKPELHWKHAIVFTVLTVLALVAANFARPKSVRA